MILTPIIFAVCIAALFAWGKANHIIKYFSLDIPMNTPD